MLRVDVFCGMGYDLISSAVRTFVEGLSGALDSPATMSMEIIRGYSCKGDIPGTFKRFPLAGPNTDSEVEKQRRRCAASMKFHPLTFNSNVYLNF